MDEACFDAVTPRGRTCGTNCFIAARTASVVRSGALVRERVCVRRDTLEISRVSCLCGELHDQASRFRSAIWRVSFLLHFVVDISRLVTFDVPFYLFRDKIPNSPGFSPKMLKWPGNFRKC